MAVTVKKEGTGAISALDVVRYAEDNLILDNENSWWAFYKLSGVTYDLLSYSRKHEKFSAIENALGTLAHRVKILSLVRNFHREDYITGLRQKNPASAKYNAWTDMVGAHIGSRTPFYREFYLAVRLRGAPGSFIEFSEAVGRRVERGVRAAMKTPLRFPPSELEAAREQAEVMAGRFGSLIARKATPEDLMWLVRRGPYRAVGEPPMLEGWKPKAFVHDEPDGTTSVGNRFYEPDVAELKRLIGDVPMKQRLRQLEFSHGEGVKSYQRILAISSMPAVKELRFPGCEWAFLDMPVDMVLDFDVIPSGASERQRKSKARRVKEQTVHVDEAGDEVNVQLAAAHAENRELEMQNQQHKPRLDCHVTICVSSDTEAGLDSLTQQVKQSFSQLKIGVSLSRGSQIAGFADFLPCGGRRLTHYPQPMGSTTLSGAMPIGENALGDGRGFYIGYPTVGNGVVALDPELPMRELNMSGSTGIVGDLGSGKTFLYQMLMGYYGMADYQCLLIDPKGDSEKMKGAPEIAEMMRTIRIAADSPTRLPIMSVFPPGQEKQAQGLLTGFLLDVLETREDRQLRQTVRLIVREFMAREARKRTVQGLLDEFLKASKNPESTPKQQEAAKQAGDEVDYYSSHELAEIVLSDEASYGDVLAAERASDPITVIQTDGLELPSKDELSENRLSEEQRISQAILSVVAASSFQMAARDRFSARKPFKALGFDEAWRFLASADGAKVLKYIIREGRSMNVAAYVLTQLWADLETENIASLLPIRFMGKQPTDEDDIERGLNTLGVDADRAVIDLVKSFGSGEFIHQDAYGKIGPMYVDPVPKEWLTDMASTPTG